VCGGGGVIDRERWGERNRRRDGETRVAKLNPAAADATAPGAGSSSSLLLSSLELSDAQVYEP